MLKRIKEIEAKILEYARDNKLDAHTGVWLVRGVRKYCNHMEHFTVNFVKGGWTDEGYDNECSYFFNDRLGLAFYNGKEHTKTEYELQGETFEDEAKEVAEIIARKTEDWIETEEYWADPNETLPF